MRRGQANPQATMHVIIQANRDRGSWEEQAQFNEGTNWSSCLNLVFGQKHKLKFPENLRSLFTRIGPHCLSETQSHPFACVLTSFSVIITSHATLTVLLA